MKQKTFTKADDEFQKVAKDIFQKFKEKLSLDVDPEQIMFLRTDGDKKAYAYCKPIHDEYRLLTEKKFFIVIVNNRFNELKTDAEKKHVILHELKHCDVSESGKPRLIKHNLEDFSELLKDPSWNIEITT